MEHKLIQDSGRKKGTSGVYEIRNTFNDKVYVGSSANIEKRLAEHQRKLKNGSHSSSHLQSAWNKYGPCNFTFRKLLVCDVTNLVFYEQRFIDGYMAANPECGYNKRLIAHSNAGIKHSEQTKKRVSASMIGRVVAPETREKISCALLGSLHTPEAKQKMSLANKGRKLTAAQKEGRGKLSFKKASEIRALHAATSMKQVQLASMFGVSRRTVSDLIRGITWN